MDRRTPQRRSEVLEGSASRVQPGRTVGGHSQAAVRARQTRPPRREWLEAGIAMPRITLTGPEQLELRDALIASFMPERMIDLLTSLDKDYTAITVAGYDYLGNALV